MARCILESLRLLSLLAASGLLAGCSLLPDVLHEPQFHNPFPQLHRVAVLPFYNQSADPHVNQDEVALAYANELQQIPGFEVMPVGTAKAILQAHKIEPQTTEDFQRLAQLMGVDVIVAGSVTEYTPYYPPRMGLSVNWYAANPGFHPIPAGYGLPWGTAEEEYIPEALVREAEFELAREQLKTQTPTVPPEFDAFRQWAPRPTSLRPNEPPAVDSEQTENGGSGAGESTRAGQGEWNSGETSSSALRVTNVEVAPRRRSRGDSATLAGAQVLELAGNAEETVKKEVGPQGGAREPIGTGVLSANVPVGTSFPPGWPDPRGFVPAPPCPQRPAFIPSHSPVITHTRLYDGHDSDITTALANYYYFRDDARFGGWQAYLQRSDDFIRFCCYLHVTETLSARGGAGKTRVVWRWPIGRYER